MRRFWQLAKEAVGAWSGDYAPSMGAALSYYTLFSIAPLLLIVIAVAGFFFGQEAARGEIFEQLRGLMGVEGARAIESLLVNAHKPAAGLVATIAGVAALLLGATGVFGELQNALDRIWRVPRAGGGLRNLLRGKLLSFSLVLAIAFLLMVSLVLSAALSALGTWWGVHFLDTLGSFLLITVLFALIYKLVPRTHVRWSDVWIGAAVTSALFAAGKLAIGFYLGRSSVASAFGAAGSLVVLMVWVYYSAQIFLLGAEFTRAYAHARGGRTEHSQNARTESH